MEVLPCSATTRIEETHADHRFGRFLNRDFAEYHIPVNADIHDIDVLFADEDDRVVRYR